MADDYGPKNEPIFSGDGAFKPAENPTEAAAYAAKVGNRKVGTRAQRLALTGKDRWDGLEFYETDTHLTYVYAASTSSWGSLFTIEQTASSGFFAAASGWSLSGGNQFFTRVGPVGQGYASFKRSGGAIEQPSSGNLTNVVVGQIAYQPVQLATGTSGKAGRGAFYTFDPDGTVNLTAVVARDTSDGGSSTIATDETFSFGIFTAFRF